MMGEPFDLLGQALGKEAFNGFDNAPVQDTPGRSCSRLP